VEGGTKGRDEMMKMIPLTKIRLDFQPPEVLDEKKVIEYVTKIRNKEALPVIHLRFDGNSYFLQDGFHRVEAAKRCGLKTLKAEITPGTLKDMEKEFQTSLESARAKLRQESQVAE
jgi:ParB-like chromosome segregation protein Spo0J